MRKVSYYGTKTSDILSVSLSSHLKALLLFAMTALSFDFLILVFLFVLLVTDDTRVGCGVEWKKNRPLLPTVSRSR